MLPVGLNTTQPYSSQESSSATVSTEFEVRDEVFIYNEDLSNALVLKWECKYSGNIVRVSAIPDKNRTFGTFYLDVYINDVKSVGNSVQLNSSDSESVSLATSIAVSSGDIVKLYASSSSFSPDSNRVVGSITIQAN